MMMIMLVFLWCKCIGRFARQRTLWIFLFLGEKAGQHCFRIQGPSSIFMIMNMLCVLLVLYGSHYTTIEVMVSWEKKLVEKWFLLLYAVQGGKVIRYAICWWWTKFDYNILWGIFLLTIGVQLRCVGLHYINIVTTTQYTHTWLLNASNYDGVPVTGTFKFFGNHSYIMRWVFSIEGISSRWHHPPPWRPSSMTPWSGDDRRIDVKVKNLFECTP